ncbi:hypothetical protein EIP86_008619 [Pleurotus ostreatoroseus]|nr:hypothetical protein EIP86_008619 [Pleurotus ostreatoroseus]
MNTEKSRWNIVSDPIVDAQGQGILIPSDFSEALRVTAKTKSTFPLRQDDLYKRGKQLIVASIEAGVTVMRAHVEVDENVDSVCLETGIRLKKEYEALCDVQIAVFAQEPLFNSRSSGPGRNWDLLQSAAAIAEVEAVGSAPYVEPDEKKAKENTLLIFDLAHKHELHVDFHLDYNLDASSEPHIWFVLQQLRDRIKNGTWKRDKHVCIGHATRLTLWSDEEWSTFARVVADDDLPISLVGLPQSDMYMMGRGMHPTPRCTLDPIRLTNKHGIRAAMAVNNVDNAFTPQGAPDPLALCPLGVALFQTGTRRDCATLVVRRFEFNSVCSAHSSVSSHAGRSNTHRKQSPSTPALQSGKDLRRLRLLL